MYTDSTHVLMFRSKPVFDATRKPKWFPEEGRIPIPMDGIDLETVRSLTYEYYDVVNTLTSELIVLIDQLGFTCIERGCSLDEVREYVVSDASSFLRYFYANHEELTSYRKWSGSDIRMLLYLFQVLRAHYQALKEWIIYRTKKHGSGHSQSGSLSLSV